MTIVDGAILLTIVTSVLLAAAQGFVFEIFSLSGAVVGFILAMWEYSRVAPWFMQYVKSAAVADIAAFLSILFACVLLAGMVGRMVRWAMHGGGLKTADRVLGGAFGLVRGVLLVTAAVMAIAAFVPESQMLARSELASYFLLSARAAVWLAPAEMRSKVKHGAISLPEAVPAVAGAVTGKSPAAKR